MTHVRLIGIAVAIAALAACQPSADTPTSASPTATSTASNPNTAPAEVAAPVYSTAAPTQPSPAASTLATAVSESGPEAAYDPTSISTQLDSANAVIAGGRASAREVRELLDSYLSRQGLSEGPQIKGGSRVNVLVEVKATTRKPGERGFQNSRRTAYQRAYLTALGKFLSQRAQDIQNQMGSVFRDNSDNMRLLQEACAPSRDQVIAEKLNVLAEAVVDQALAKLDAASGQAPAEPPQFTCPAQEELFRSFTSRRAAEELSGMRVVFSTEVNGQVGVVLVHSSKFEDTARRLLNAQGTRAPLGDPLGELRDKLNSELDPQTLRGTFGTRILTASNGESIIVSFGQSGPDIGPADSDRVIDRKFDSARRLAYNEAAAELARFARTMAVFTSKTTTIDESGKYVDLKSGAYEESALVAEQLLETVETNSRLTVQGVAQVHSWEFDEDANEQALVGVVLAWSPSLQSTFGRDAPSPAAASAKPVRSTGKAEQHRAQGAEMKEDW